MNLLDSDRALEMHEQAVRQRQHGQAIESRMSDNEALRLMQYDPDPVLQARILRHRSRTIFNFFNDHDGALDDLHVALNVLADANEPEHIAEIYIDRSVLLAATGNIKESRLDLERALVLDISDLMRQKLAMFQSYLNTVGAPFTVKK